MPVAIQVPVTRCAAGSIRRLGCGDQARAHQDERAFLEASLAERQAREAAEEARRRHELETAQKLAETEKRRAEEQTRSASQLRQRATLLAGALLVAAVLAFAAVLFARQSNQNAQRAQAERNNAEYQRQVAFARELSVNAVNNLAADPERSILLALQAASVSSTGGKPILLEAEEALHRAVQASRLQFTLRGHTAGLYRIAYSPDGKRLATASIDKTAKVWDAATGKELLTLIGHTGGVGSIVFTADGKRLATSSWNDEPEHTANVYDVETGKLLLTLTGHTSALWDIASGPDGRRLATGDGEPRQNRQSVGHFPGGKPRLAHHCWSQRSIPTCCL
jgi:hypothetical protein